MACRAIIKSGRISVWHPKRPLPRLLLIRICRARLASVYATPEDLDVWVGALAEDHVNGGLCGELIFTILRDQFTRVRDGDRFWFETYLPPSMVRQIQKQTLAKIIQPQHANRERAAGRRVSRAANQ